MTRFPNELGNIDDYPARRHLAKWLTGFGTSLLGDQVYFICLAWAAVQVASPAQVGLILAAGSIPRAACLLLGGVLADRVNLKRLIMVSDAGRALSAFLIGALLASGDAEIWHLVALAVAFGVLDGIFLPAVSAAPPRLAPPQDMSRVQGAKTVVQRLSIVVGAPLAGWTVVSHGLSTAFYVCALFFIFSLCALVTIRMLSLGKTVTDSQLGGIRGWSRDLLAGFQAIRQRSTLMTILLVLALADFGFAGPLNVGLPLLVQARGWEVSVMGYLLGAFGLGSALSGLFLALIKTIKHPLAIAAISLAIMGGALAGVGLAREPELAIVLIFCFGLGSGAGATLLNALLVTLTPPQELGRVMSVSSLASYGGIPISYALSGLLVTWFGTVAPFIFGALCAIAAAVVATARRDAQSNL